MNLYGGMSLAILSNVENGISKSELKKRYGQWGGAQENVLNKLIGKNVITLKDDKLAFSTGDLELFTKKIKLLENSIEDYISLLPEKDYVPWGVFVFLSNEKIWHAVENKIIYSINKKNDIKTSLLWSVYKSIFNTGYADLKQVIKMSNIYLEDISLVTNELLIFPDLIKRKKVNGAEYILFSRNFTDWMVKP